MISTSTSVAIADKQNNYDNYLLVSNVKKIGSKETSACEKIGRIALLIFLFPLLLVRDVLVFAFSSVAEGVADSTKVKTALKRQLTELLSDPKTVTLLATKLGEVIQKEEFINKAIASVREVIASENFAADIASVFGKKVVKNALIELIQKPDVTAALIELIQKPQVSEALQKEIEKLCNSKDVEQMLTTLLTDSATTSLKSQDLKKQAVTFTRNTCTSLACSKPVVIGGSTLALACSALVYLVYAVANT